MKKSIKRVISLSAIGVMLLASLTGCGTKDTASNDNVFKIGSMGPLTGDYASYGKSVKGGIDIAIKEINDAGGVGKNGMKFESTFLDDEAGAELAITVYNKLMDEGVNAIIGAVTSGSCLAITDLTKEDGILQITPSGSENSITKNDNVFRICFTDPLQGVTMANYAVENFGKIAILYDVSVDYSAGMAKAFKEEVTAKGGSIVAMESFTAGDVDFNTQLTTIKSSGADVIFVPAYYTEVALILNQAKKADMNIPFLGGDGWDGVLALLEDTSVAEGSIFLSPFIADDEATNVKSFVKAYSDAYNQIPDQFAADGYDSVYVLKAAIEKAESSKSEDLIKAMTEIQVDGTTGSMTFDVTGEPNKKAKLVEIKEGKYTSKDMN